MNKNYWCGIRGVYQIWHGQWADPEVKYKNYICNEWDLQESMYITMKDRIADGEDWGDPDNDNDFMNFCKQNADLVKQDIIELSTGGVYESKKTMLRKDKALLESLTKRYGKNNVLNELEDKTITNAFRKAKYRGRWQQAKTFGDEIYNRVEKNIDNLELEPIFRGVDWEEYVVKIFINKDEKNPIAFLYLKNVTGVEIVNVVAKYVPTEDDLKHYYLKYILKKFNQLTNNNIQYDNIDYIPISNIWKISDFSFDDKKTAREFTNAINILNGLFDVDMSVNWHDYHTQGSSREYGFDEDGNYIRESAGRIATRYANPDVWFDNTSFQELEELTGYFIYDFYLKYEDEVEAEEAFIAACEEWWNNHTPAQKRKIFNEHYINA